MTRREIHMGIITTGVQSALVTLEAMDASARRLREETPPDTQEITDIRYIERKIEQARRALLVLGGELGVVERHR